MPSPTSRPFHVAVSFLTLCLGLGISAPTLAAPPAVAATCAACHGATGNSADAQYPALAGQKPAYLIRQLEAFRGGERTSALMKPLVEKLTDAQIAALADYFASQTRAPASVSLASDARRGAVIYRTGGGAGTACAACHASGGFGGGMMGGGGMMMRTRPAITPILYGQYAGYLATQLDAFADGTRPNSVMSPIAQRLSKADRKAVADYLTSVR
ncbi:MAG: cytochrome c4 [Paracoccaceae bacterium]|nr:cytochrome c4 [Paracoccaceae bacterium]